MELLHSLRSWAMYSLQPWLVRWRWLLVAWVLPLMVVFGGALYASSALSVSCDDQPACVTLSELHDGASLPEAIHIFDRTGAPLAHVAGPLRMALPEERYPEQIAAAFVAVEDRRFWQHEGVDFRGIFRAAMRNLSAGGVEEGASTIPMQLVRTLWAGSLKDVGPWRRKIIEARTAPRLIEELGHREVLRLYLNSIYMGDGLYGVEAAARHYFGTSVDSLNLAQMATIVGMTPAPEYLEPREHPERSRTRRDVVLGVLAQAGVVTEEEAEAARKRPIETSTAPALPRTRNHLTAAVTQAIREVAPELAGEPGLRVFTTIDTVVQAAGEQAIADQLERIESGSYGEFLVGEGEQALEAAGVALDPSNGAIRAWIGGRDFGRTQFDHVSQARRQVGSLIKPFIVAKALESGLGMMSLVATDSVRIDSREGAWSPADHVRELMLPIREALVQSSNRAAVNLGQSLGLGVVSQAGQEMGISAPIPRMPSSVIGAFEATLLDMTGAYAVFGNQGYRVTPYLIERIEDPLGRVLWSHTTPLERARPLDEATSFLVLDAMGDVVDRGTGWRVRAAGYRGPAAGKTGTTNEGRDAWFIGLVPDLVAGIWVGFDQPRTIVEDAGGGGVLAAPAWARWMSDVDEALDQPRAEWRVPLGLRQVRYNPQTGETVPDDCHSGAASQFVEAYIQEGRGHVRACPGSFRGFLDNIWRAIVPRDPEPVVGRPGPGGGDGGEDDGGDG
jgi:penicillin-binding protein 1A